MNALAVLAPVRALAHPRDPHRILLRRALRVAVVMPAVLAVVGFWFDRKEMASFGAFGAFAMLGMTDYAGPLHRRALGYLGLTVVGGGLVALGTVCSSSVVVAALVMVAVGFLVQFVGVFGGYIAASAPALVLAFVLPATLPTPPDHLPERVAGWAVAGVLSAITSVTLWPVQERRAIRAAVAASCRDLADLVGAIAAAGPVAELDERHERARASVLAARDTYRQSPYRPAGPGAHDRAVVFLLGELVWVYGTSRAVPVPAAERDRPLLAAAARCLADCAARLEGGRGGRVDVGELEHARDEQLARLGNLPATALAHGAEPVEVATSVGAALQPRILSYAVLSVALATDMARGIRRPAVPDPEPEASLATATAPALAPVEAERGVAGRALDTVRVHLGPDSVAFRNALRMGVALGGAVAVALGGRVPHAFWVALGTLGALRSNALGTGFTVLQALAGTLVGFVVGGGLVTVTGSDAVLWCALVPSVFLAAYAPTAISYAAGQAAFTVLVVVMFNLLEPEGWITGVVRVENIALGCAVGLAASLLFWPRGASAQLRDAVTTLLDASGREFADVIGTWLSGRPAEALPPLEARAALARADAALDVYLTERGSRPLAPAQASALVTAGVCVHFASLAARRMSVTHPGPSPCAPAVERMERSAREAAAHLVAVAAGSGRGVGAAGRRPAVTDPAIVECLARARGAAAGADLTGLLRPAWAASWVDEVYAVGDRLAQVLDEPTGVPAGRQDGRGS